MFISRTIFIASISLIFEGQTAVAQEKKFAGYVTSSTVEATEVGVEILEKGGNAFDAAVAVSLAVAASGPASSGVFGQTVMLVQPADGEPYVIHGTTLSPASIPDNVTREQLTGGRTASTIPSTLKVLSYTLKNYGSGNFSWEQLVNPSVKILEEGFKVGPFRHKAFNYYGLGFKDQKEAAEMFFKPDGLPYQLGETFRHPIMAKTMQRIAEKGADEFYKGDMAKEIAADMAINGGWITYDDLANFPDPKIVEPIKSTYRGYEIVSLPPPFGGWIMMQILNLLEAQTPEAIDTDDAERRIALLNAMRLGHGTRANDPVPGFYDYDADVSIKISKREATRMLEHYKSGMGGETTHYSVVDGEGNAIAVTQSIDNYFGGLTVHPQLGFIYNNYMQSFRLKDDGSPYVLKENEMPLSSMTGTIVKKDGETQMVLGSPASARIISAVAQVTSYWIDVEKDIKNAVDAYRVHVVPDNKAYIEGPIVDSALLKAMAKYDYSLNRPSYGVSDSQYDPYFGGVHALAKQDGKWAGAADPRRDGRAKVAWKE
ncbi:MAG: hypothetical protein HOH18_07520 [Kordiimonadaceae bacterium]|nr:hypothetical protein [Kordiimonadaceae bacterium]MBT7583720.1 hypothetical protein [Kordiimonadaceae bacterium]